MWPEDLTHPFIIATMTGVLAAFTGFHPPEPVGRLIDYLAQAAAPCALFAMGVTLAMRPLKRVPAEIGYIVPASLRCCRWSCGSICRWPQLRSRLGYTALLLSSLPTATNVFVIGQPIWCLAGTRLGNDPDHHAVVGGERVDDALPDRSGLLAADLVP